MVKTNDLTRYEVVLLLADGRKFLVGYTPRRSIPGLHAATVRFGRDILKLMPDLSDDAVMTKKDGKLHLGNGASVSFSGRTQRDAQHSPLTFVTA